MEKIRGRTSQHGHGWVGVADLLCTYVDSDGRNGARCIPSLYVTSIIKRRSLQGTLLWIATSLCFVIEACRRPAGSSCLAMQALMVLRYLMRSIKCATRSGGRRLTFSGKTPPVQLLAQATAP